MQVAGTGTPCEQAQERVCGVGCRSLSRMRRSSGCGVAQHRESVPQ